MIYIQNDSNDPYFNHALELYAMREMDEDVFILWRNRPSILIGRNQNTLSEINMDYVNEKKIDVVRRASGGGTVFCDLGNINFSFITRKGQTSNLDRQDGAPKDLGGEKTLSCCGFEKFAMPVVSALKALGVEAVFSGRNDILVEGAKISGNAQYHEGNKLLHHGTILYDGDLSLLAGALKSKPLKFKDKSIKSVASRVTNIAKHMTEKMDVLAFREYLRSYIMKAHQIEKIYQLTEQDLKAIAIIQKEKFESYDWNFGKSPSYTFSNDVRFPAGTFEFQAKVKGGKIEALQINGDFFGEVPMENLCEKLLGKPFEFKALQGVLETLDLEPYAQNLKKDEFLSGLMDLKKGKPDWLKVKLQGGRETEKVKVILSELSLNTVCQEANCPNRMECYNKGTATFMILGRNCTRNCTFCNVSRALPDPVDIDEPEKVALAVEKLSLKHAVITSVTRDDLEDQGAEHFAQTVKAIRARTPQVDIELLIPDLSGREDLLDIVIDSQPDVLNHNVETVPELYDTVRPMADFERSLSVLAYFKKRAPQIKTKSGIMLGLGETMAQIEETLKALRRVDCDMLTVGQYLQPSPEHIAVVEYVRPEQFEVIRQMAEALGFKSVSSAPLVRSSYHADEMNF